MVTIGGGVGTQAFIKLTFKLFLIVAWLDRSSVIYIYIYVSLFWAGSNGACVICFKQENCYNLFVVHFNIPLHHCLHGRISNCFIDCVYKTKLCLEQFTLTLPAGGIELSR